MRPGLLALFLMATPAAGQEEVPLLQLEEGETLETELRADLNADGNPDLAYVAAKQDARALRVVLTFVNETDFGQLPAQVLALDPYPLADATMKVTGTNQAGRVLVVQELNGGTTAVLSTYRFRLDRQLGAMRLIGLDATLYSRTFAHDGSEASWNLLTGDFVTRKLLLIRTPDSSGRAYDIVGQKRRKKASPPIRLEDSPDGSEIIGYPAGN